MISENGDFGRQNEVFYYSVLKLRTTAKKQWYIRVCLSDNLLYVL